MKQETPQDARAERTGGHAWRWSPAWALAALSLCMLLSSLGTSVANVALPTLAQAFAASFQATQWVVLAYLLTITALIVGVGRLGDIVGRRRLLLIGLAVFTASSIVCALAPALWVLIAARAVQGLGAAVMMALALAMVSETVPKDKIGGAMGLLGTMSAVGTALGPVLGGFLIAGFGWQAMFLVNAPLGLLALFLAYRSLPTDGAVSTASDARFDALGTLLLALALSAYALAMTVGGGRFSALNLALLVAAVLGGALFVFAEARVTSPLIRLTVFHDMRLNVGLCASAIASTVVMTTLIVGPFYLSRALGLDPASVGMVMTVGPLVAAAAGIPAGRLVDRFGVQGMTLVGLVGMGIACAALSLIPSSLGVPGYVVPLAVLTAGYALFQAANNAAIMREVGVDRRGVVSGMLNLSRNLGLITGASLMGAVLAFGAGAGDLSAASSGAVAVGMHFTFGFAAALVLAAIAAVAHNVRTGIALRSGGVPVDGPPRTP